MATADWAAAAAEFEGVEDAREVVERLAQAGLTGLVAPERGRPDAGAIAAAREALAYRSPLADAILAVLGLGCYPVAVAGDEALRREFVDPVRAGRAACGFALTEPEAGSDVSGMKTMAMRVGGGDEPSWVLDGKKTFISNAPIADWFVVFAMAHDGPTAFVVERDDDGVTIVEDVPMSVPHPIGSVELRQTRVPASRRLGEPGQGIKLALQTLDVFRPTVGAAACGMAARALDEAIARVKSRRQFGKALAEFQLTQARLAECATELLAARALVRQACASLAAGAREAKMHSAMAKLYATEAAQRIIDAAVQLWGGLGVKKGVPVEALYREVRALRIYEGTSEIQKLIIARELLK